MRELGACHTKTYFTNKSILLTYHKHFDNASKYWSAGSIEYNITG